MLHETIKNLHQEELNVETVAPTLLLDKNGLRPFFSKTILLFPRPTEFRYSISDVLGVVSDLLFAMQQKLVVNVVLGTKYDFNALFFVVILFL